MSYTALVLGAAGVVTVVDLAVVGLLRRRAFWTAYAIVLGFQLLTNGWLTGRGIVRYDADAILGWRFAFAPVEDLLFGFALVLWTLDAWVWWGRRTRRCVRPGVRKRSRVFGRNGRQPGAAGPGIRGQRDA
jgi:lycopene cyclase domain-containing protein